MKNISLLRQFQPGMQHVCSVNGEYTYKVLGVDEKENEVAVRCEYNGKLYVSEFNSVREAPLFWCEDKPVYVGDKLWHPEYSDKLLGKFRSYIHETIEYVTLTDVLGGHPTIPVSELSWEKKKVKVTRWMNIYQSMGCRHYETKESANSAAHPDRIACIEVSWEQ